jgi:hypothetical protein
MKGEIKQDGKNWNIDFFCSKTEEECLESFTPKGYNQSTITSVWKQANKKSTPNPSKKVDSEKEG